MSSHRPTFAVLVAFVLSACSAVSEPPPDGGQPSLDGGQPSSDGGPFDPDGTRFPLTGVGFASGTFAERLSAAFDGLLDQTAAQSASTPIYLNLEDAPLLFREFDCELALRRVVVHAPDDVGFFSGPDGASNTGTVHVVSRRLESSRFRSIASLPVPAGAGATIVFDLDTLGSPTDGVAYGITFEADDPRPATVHVAEVELFGFCSGPSAVIDWATTPFVCSDVECAAVENPGGLERRTVTCARSTGGTASEGMCEAQKPASTGTACTLRCPHTLRFVGMRAFSYGDDSGWLHEGNPTMRAGPLPSAVSRGRSVGVIEGKPCSILTVNPLTRFTAGNCTQPDAPGQYCAFRCE